MCEIKQKLVAVRVFFVILGLIAASNIFGQKSKITEGGISSGIPYASMDFENINLTNGNVNLSFPLAKLKGRGGVGFGFALHYNSKLWQTVQNPVWINGNQTYQNYVAEALEAGWNNPNAIGVYRFDLINRNSGMDAPVGNTCIDAWRLAYRWKVEIKAPDGRKIEFRPIGHSDIPPGNQSTEIGYFNVSPEGRITSVTGGNNNCTVTETGPSATPMTYYSSDGSGIRLSMTATGWEMSMPDGSRVVQLPNKQQIIDAKGNTIETALVNLPDGTQAGGWVDQFGRYAAAKTISQSETDYYQRGFDGALLTWRVLWKKVYVKKQYTTTCNSCGNTRGEVVDAVAEFELNVIDRVVLPEQQGEYVFDYYANNTDTGQESPGWGEVKSITIPTGAKIYYNYQGSTIEEPQTFPLVRSDQVLKNTGKIVNKKLEFTETNYGETPQIREDNWYYTYSPNLNNWTEILSPDGSISKQYYFDVVNDEQKGGQVWKEEKPGGTKIERVWANNLPVGIQFGSGNRMNSYVKTEIVTIPDSNGSPSLSKITDFTVDQNGNSIRTSEYDWIPANSSAIQRNSSGVVTGFSGLSPARTSLSEYYNPTPESGQQTSSPNAYYSLTTPPSLRSLAKSSEARTGSAFGTVVSRSEIVYDNNPSAPTVGNPTLVSTWDSHKTGTYVPYTSPLSGSNSISVSTQYDGYGNPISTTDAMGVQTSITYDTNNLYPTLTVVASNYSSLKRSTETVYDFHTGLVTSATDVENGATTGTNYDSLGRPISASAPDGTSTSTAYNDTQRYVVVRSDVHVAGDQRKVATQFYDQLGRVRLSKTLEDATSQSETNETDGIKVQTRYLTGNPYSYQMTSNPFRAASVGTANEPTMGWTVSKTKNTGRESSVTTYSGNGIPFEFGGGNGNSTGTVVTEVDGKMTTVTDQALKKRRSVTNGLGQLERVDEPDINGSLTQSTTYSYDTLNNLTTVNQGGQQRTFSYSSLSRLINATNPELGGMGAANGTINYGYDNNGNLTSKTDPRGVTTTYIYDALNRVTNRNYSGAGNSSTYLASPNVTYTYDNLPHAKGRLTKVTAGAMTTEYTEFDILGRVKASRQNTDGTEYGGMTYTYNASGALVEQKYPSGRVVKTTLDADGSVFSVQSKKTTHPTYWNYAWGMKYNAAGGLTEMQYGNGRWESTQYNERLQPTQIALGYTPNSTHQLKLNYSYGGWQNNGNVTSQTVEIWRKGQDPVKFYQEYQYDNLNRIKEAKETDITSDGSTQTWKQVYDIDRYGNRMFGAGTTTIGGCPTQVCNPAPDIRNRLVGYSYDNAGNTTVDGMGQQFTYDSENKQVSVKNSSNVLIGEYSYDGDGKRVKKYVPSSGETTVFVYDAMGKSVAEYSNIVEPQSAAKVAYLTNDHLGSPRLNTDRDGNITARNDYLPYGEEITVSLTPQRTDIGYTPDTVRKQFTGYERDYEVDLDFAKARMYASKNGRFTTIDPSQKSIDFMTPQTWNRFSYCYNNPLTLIDENGKWPTRRHRELIRNSFDGLSDKEIGLIQTGSEIADVFSGGKPISTLWPSDAHIHAMTEEGLTEDEARGNAATYLNGMLEKVKGLQKAHETRGGKGISESALLALGQATHVYEDMTSPAHGFDKVFALPTVQVRIMMPGLPTMTLDVVDPITLKREMDKHEDEESGEPTDEQRAKTALYSRAFFYLAFEKEFQRLNMSDSERAGAIELAEKYRKKK